MPRRTKAVATTTDVLGRRRAVTSRSFGTIRQLPSGRYQASYVGLDGDRYKGPHTFDTKAAAEAWLAPHHDAIARRTWRAPRVIDAQRFGAYAEAFINQRRKANGDPLTPLSLSNYRTDLNRALATFHTMPLEDITAPLVRKWFTSWSELFPILWSRTNYAASSWICPSVR